jgi:hypothetical protein
LSIYRLIGDGNTATQSAIINLHRHINHPAACSYNNPVELRLRSILRLISADQYLSNIRQWQKAKVKVAP